MYGSGRLSIAETIEVTGTGRSVLRRSLAHEADKPPSTETVTVQ
jgi:hypothetical protein